MFSGLSQKLKLNRDDNGKPMVSSKRTSIGVALLVIMIAVFSAIPQPVNASLYFDGDDVICELIFVFSYPDGTVSSTSIRNDSFSGGVSVPVGTYLYELIIFANVSATYYTPENSGTGSSVNPKSNTWLNMTLTAPNSAIIYDNHKQVDDALAYDSSDTYLGAGYYSNAEYYMVYGSFLLQRPLTEGIWSIDITLFLT